MIKELLKHGRVDARDTRGCTALLKAAEEGHVDCVQLLLSQKAEVDGSDYQETTPLQIAVQLRQMDVLQVLLDHGAEVNRAGSNGYTPLICAAYNADHAAVTKLIEAKADASLVSRSAP